MKLWASLLLLFTMPLAAQQPAADKPPDKGSAKGITLKAGSDEPVRRAAIRLRSSESDARTYQATTDSEGRFEIKDIEPGRYSLHVEREGYRVQRLGVGSVWIRSRERLSVNVGPGQKLDIVAYLVPGGVIAGRVVDAEGEPVSNADVQALRNIYIAGKRRLTPVEHARTNDLGEYRLHGLRAGSYYLRAGPGPNRNPAPALASGSSPDKEQLVYAPSFYPGVADKAEATRLDVGAGQEVRADFFLIPTQAVRLRGRVIGTIEPGARVMLAPSEGFGFGFGSGFRESAEVQKDGTFQFDAVLPGPYTAIAFIVSPQGMSHLGSQKIDVGKTDVDNLALSAAPPGKAALRGRVRIEGSSSIDPELLTVFLRPDHPDDFSQYIRFAGRGRGLAAVKSDSTFELEDVGDGTYRVEVSARRGMSLSADLSGLYLKSATVGKSDARDEGFTISEGRAGGSIEIVLSSAGAQIEGIVLDDKHVPAAGVRVLAAPEEKRRHLEGWYENDVTDQNGKFVMRGVSPGSYTVLAWDGDEIFYGSNDPDRIKKYENRGVNVTLKESERKAVELKAIKVDEE